LTIISIFFDLHPTAPLAFAFAPAHNPTIEATNTYHINTTSQKMSQPNVNTTWNSQRIPLPLHPPRNKHQKKLVPDANKADNTKDGYNTVKTNTNHNQYLRENQLMN
jgi:hypothetical protein